MHNNLTLLLSGAALTLSLASSDALAQRTASYTYNNFGQVLTMDGPRTDVADVMTYEYDNQGNRTKMTNALGHQTHYTSYDALGYLLSMTDPNGVVTNYTYDLRQRLTSFTAAAGTPLAATTTLEYDLVGNLTGIIQPNGARLNYEYDAAHRLVAMEDGLGNRMEYTLDAAGNVTQQDIRDPLGALASTRTMAYDELSRLIETVGADAQTTGYAYDTNDNLVTAEDGFSNPTSRSVDALDRVIKETDRDLNDVSFTYDTEDRLTSVTDQRGLTTTYTYNAYGDLTQQNSPDTGITTFVYDAASNLTRRTDARGEVSTYTYDALNRPLTVSFASNASENVSYTYDQGAQGIGRLTQIADEAGQANYRYNALGQMTGKTVQIDGVSYITGYSYDRAGNMTQIAYPSGRLLNLTLDSLGRVTGITTQESAALAAQTVVQSVEYLPFGPASAYTYGNGINQSIAYDEDYRISAITSQGVLDRFYQYDANNNIVDIIDHENGSSDQGFGYDILDRLTSADGAYGQISYDYDPVGNRKQRVLDDGSSVITENYNYAANANQLDSITGSPGGRRDFNYDVAGNQTSGETAEGNSLSHSYNAAGRPEQGSGPNGSASYTHNALGQRVKIQTGANTIEHYHYDEYGNLIAVTDSSGSAQREYLYLGEQKIAMLVDDSQAGGSTGGNTGGNGNGADADSDGIADANDNCVNSANPNQTDSDADGIGNVCDTEQISVTSIGTEDGWVRESGEHSNVGGARNSGATNNKSLRMGDNGGDRQYKALLSFNLSALPSSAVLQSMALNLTRQNGSIVGNPSSLGAITIDLKTGSFSNNAAVQNGDFQAPATATNVGTLADGLNAVGSITPTGIAATQAARSSGQTKLQLRLQYAQDDDDDRRNDFTGYFSGKNGNANRRPRLTLTYTLAD